MKLNHVFPALLTGLFVLLLVSSTPVLASSGYYEYDEYYDSSSNYAEEKTVYDWLRGSYEVCTEDETESTDEPPSPEGEGPDSSSSESSSDTSSESQECGSTENFDPYPDYSYPNASSYRLPASTDIFDLFSGGFFYMEGVKEIDQSQSEEDREEAFEKVNERLERGQYYKFDDRVFRNPTEAVNQWNIYNGREYGRFNSAVGRRSLIVPERDKGKDFSVSYPEAGSIETVTNYEGKEIEIPEDPFITQAYVGVHNISNTQYLHEYRKENSVYSKSPYIIGSYGEVSTVLSIKHDTIRSVYEGLDVGSLSYSYVPWGEKLENSEIKLVQTTGTPTHTCLEEENGCDVSVGDELGWANGFTRMQYDIPEQYIDPNEKFKFVITGDVSVNVTRYTYRHEKTGTKCTGWVEKSSGEPVSNPDTYNPDNLVCPEENKEDVTKWKYKSDLDKRFTVSKEMSTDSREFQFQPGFNHISRDESGSDSDYGDDITITEGILPDNQYVYKIETDIAGDRQPWKSIQTTYDSKIYSGWHHFSSREKSWDRMYSSEYENQNTFRWPWETPEDSGIYVSRVRPLSVHTFQFTEPSTDLTSGSDAMRLLDYSYQPYKNKNQALLDYHESCWIQYPEDPDETIDPDPAERLPCNWTQTAKGVSYVTTEDSSKQFYTGEFRKDAYVPHERLESITVTLNDRRNQFITKGFSKGVQRTDTVDETTEVEEVQFSVEKVQEDDPIPVDICSGNITESCVKDPSENSYNLYRVQLTDSDEQIITTEKEGIQEVVAEDSLRAENVAGTTENDVVNSKAVLGSDDWHYVTINTGLIEGDEANININTKDWTETDSDTQAYVDTSTSVVAQEERDTSLLRTVFYLGALLWVMVRIITKILEILGFENTNIVNILKEMLVPESDMMRLILRIAIILLIVDYVFGIF